MRTWLLSALLLVGLLGPGSVATKYFDLPPHPPPSEYGNILIDKLSSQNGQAPVGFSHWSHRQNYTCHVCHFELGFIMETNASGITEKDNQNGEFCGTCHNDDIAFGHTEENCNKCHNNGINKSLDERFRILRFLPRARYGNGVDWNKAAELHRVWPQRSLFDEGLEPVTFKKLLKLQAKMNMIPPAYFPHDKHQLWNDCADCHPDIFNVKEKTTKHFEMRYILDGKFCGACHLSVAFPLDDCQRCHWDMRD